MKQFRLLILFTILIAGFNRVCLAQAGNADMVVALDGSGDFSSIQNAIDAVPSSSDRATTIFIKRGLYNTEKLIIPSDKKNIVFVGESREETIISYHIYDCTAGKCPTEDAAKWSGDNIRTSATLTIMGEGFRAENLTIQNTAGPVGQALAITVQADKVVFINCDLKGYQDTIYLWTVGKRSYFGNCLVVGRTDYIYGSGIGYFDSCEIRSWGGGWITAPATPKDQLYGFVFNKCKVTYATNSPRAGDDGVKFRFGRPWHEYPKVAWLYCEISEMLNPLGWGDTWSMDYAATSADLHLYEYANTGAGADMSGRANWTGLRSLTTTEASNYTVQKVLAGTDNWDPTAQAPLVQQYFWTGKASSNGWLVAENWNPSAFPASGEAATVDGAFTVKASGNFAADLTLKNSARLEISGKVAVTYLSAQGTQFLAAGLDTLSGKVAIKDSAVFDISGKLILKASLSGVHKLIKKGTGLLFLAGDNSNFSGKIEIHAGSLDASVANALGKGNVEVKSGAKLIVGDNSAFYPKSRLTVTSDAFLEMKSSLTTSEFYIGNTIQPPAEYSSVSNPGLISNSGKVIVGRPSVFTFIGGTNGNWDNPSHFSPALLPLAGETVICEREIETTSTVFAADIRLRGAGKLRLRGAHQATGTIFMEEGTSFSYSTSGAGMSLKAPVKVEGNVSLIMESSNVAGSSMKLEGPISGNGKITVLNNGRGTPNTGTVVLSGNNSGFTGTWDVTKYSAKYPNDEGYLTLLEGAGEYALGASKIEVGQKNKLVISHVLAAQPKLNLTLTNSAKVALNVLAVTSEYSLNGLAVAGATYTAITDPSIYEGTGSLTVIGSMGTDEMSQSEPVRILDRAIQVDGKNSSISVYNVLGSLVYNRKNVNTVELNNFLSGIYLVKYVVDGKSGVLKFAK